MLTEREMFADVLFEVLSGEGSKDDEAWLMEMAQDLPLVGDDLDKEIKRRKRPSAGLAPERAALLAVLLARSKMCRWCKGTGFAKEIDGYKADTGWLMCSHASRANLGRA